ncbi:MAG: hypothetical protein AAF772_10105 [Acidobacteriota bacterium]
MVASSSSPRAARIALIALGAAVVCLAALALLRGTTTTGWGDEATYLAMTESLVRDADLHFDAADARRARAGARTVILQRADDGTVSYSKPLPYALLAALFFGLLDPFGAGAWGPVALNLLLLALALAVARGALRRRGWTATQADLVLATFVGGAVLLPYTLWRMTDAVQAGLTLLGLALALDGLRPASADDPAASDDAEGPGLAALVLGPALLGVVVALRITNAPVALIPAIAAVFHRRIGRAGAQLAAVGGAYLLIVGLGVLLTGVGNPYRAVRTSFTPTTGYPTETVTLGATAPGAAAPDPATVANAAIAAAAGNATAADALTPDQRFDVLPATHRTRLDVWAGLDRSLYSALYFVVGRHSGVLAYFPAALMLLLAALRRPDRVTWAVMIGGGGATAFFLGYMPDNYFGGDTFLGNRYLLPTYAALLFAPRRPPGRLLLGVTWLVAALAYGSALASVVQHRALDRTSQNHTHAGLMRLLPYESTAQDIAGRRDRYWSGDFVRFVDPFARVQPRAFTLVAGHTPSELLLARGRPAAPVRFFVRSDAPRATLLLDDRPGPFGEPRAIEVGADQRQPVVVTWTPPSPWRTHRFWFEPTQAYRVHALRLALRTPDGARARGRPASARTRSDACATATAAST